MLNGLRGKVKTWRYEGRFPLLVNLAASIYRHIRDLKTLYRLPRLQRALDQSLLVHDSDQLVDLVMDGFDGAIRPLQIHTEIRSLAKVLLEKRPRRILEIGTARGGTLFLFCRLASPGAHIVSVDLPGGWFGGGYSKWKKRLYQRFARPGQRLDLIRADSHDESTLRQVADLLDGEKFDFVLIDGDHTYEGVKSDFETYGEFIEEGATVAFHDIVPNRGDPACQVHRFWTEVSEGRAIFEFVDNWGQRGAGIGLISFRGQGEDGERSGEADADAELDPAPVSAEGLQTHQPVAA